MATASRRSRVPARPGASSVLKALLTRLCRRRLIYLTVLGLLFATFFVGTARISIALDSLAAQAFAPRPPSPEEAEPPPLLKGGGWTRPGRQPGYKSAVAQPTIAPMAYGTNARPPLAGFPPESIVRDLPADFLPSARRRLVVVGDVHGQLSALRALLSEVGFDTSPGGDRLVLAGDLVNKGPDSAGVVQLAMELGESCAAVRGNHEDRVLLARDAVRFAAQNPVSRPAGEPQLSPDAAAKVSHGDEPDRATAAALSPAQLDWLAALPAILRLPLPPPPPLSAAGTEPWNAGTLAVVHAGLVPGLPLERQDARAATTMRTLAFPAAQLRRAQARRALEAAAVTRGRNRGRPPSRVTDAQVEVEVGRRRKKAGVSEEAQLAEDRAVALPVEGREGVDWSDAWSEWQNERVADPGERTVVVYGHDAKMGLRAGELVDHKGRGRMARYAFGLDSGCVYGRQLSALVLEMGDGGVGIVHRVVQVACEAAAKQKKATNA